MKSDIQSGLSRLAIGARALFIWSRFRLKTKLTTISLHTGARLSRYRPKIGSTSVTGCIGLRTSLIRRHSPVASLLVLAEEDSLDNPIPQTSGNSWLSSWALL